MLRPHVAVSRVYLAYLYRGLRIRGQLSSMKTWSHVMNNQSYVRNFITKEISLISKNLLLTTDAQSAITVVYCSSQKRQYSGFRNGSFLRSWLRVAMFGRLNKNSKTQ